MTEFEKWDSKFRVQDFYSFNHNPIGLLYLKVRAVRRGKQIKEFIEKYSLTIKSTKINQQFSELFDVLRKREDAIQMLDTFLQDMNHEWYKEMGVDEEKLKNGLLNIDTYEWGGDQNNSLDQYLVRRYIKVVSDYGELIAKKGEIAANAWNFVQTSWYNNWTSYLIELIFKRHKRVLSAVGEIKSVDFFIDNYPIDLKVTYFPVEYMESRMIEKLGNKELTWLKKQAKEHSIFPNKSLSDDRQAGFLREELLNHGHKEVIDFLDEKRKEVVNEAMKQPEDLIKWLYENQSPRLFGAENRLFIVMVDSNNMSMSWQMKRAFSLIEPKVNGYLDNFNDNTLKEIVFDFDKKSYRSLSDIIFIVR